jgi:broad specificity phosphatase PhoE
VLRILLIRHGQTAWNAGEQGGEYFRGRIDVELNALGRQQAGQVAQALRALDISAVYASPLQRAMDTARPVAQSHGLAVEPFASLLDIDYGQWGGRSHAEVSAQWPEPYALWRTFPHQVQIPGGECLAAVRARVDQGIEWIVAHHDREIVALVGHQVVNKVLICALLGLDNSAFWRVRQDTGCVNRFDYDGQAFAVLTLNEVGHLHPRPADLDELPDR